MYCTVCGNDIFHITNLEADLPAADWHINPNTLKKIIKDNPMCTKCGNTFGVVHCADYDLNKKNAR